MKKTTLLAFMCFALAACNSNNDASPEALPQHISVPYRESTTVPTPGEKLKVNLIDITDSRCPSDVVCITMGTADMKFTVADASNQTEVKLVFRGNRDADFAVFALSGVNYILRVSEVLPYPKSNVSPKVEDYKVQVSIERK